MTKKKVAKKKAAVKRAPSKARRAQTKGAKIHDPQNNVARAEDAEDAKAKERRAKDLMRPARCRAFMRQELAQEFPGIIEGFVKAAKTGSVPHLKLATELLKPTRKATTRRKDEVQELLEEIERDEAQKREQRRREEIEWRERMGFTDAPAGSGVDGGGLL